ncbi:hypothetical protein K458DRAFT_408641 [Lentithecium fluviatile CBS 122367]|uniref:Uncharacterized protein n=1 Tax=Lentithecium fluviatile CBS 122367 TaxID=1168545 RepID=A0A6G1IKS3_9PLEO|nr:hypothetical protein K458DRAFT_408641 [Lentithecium fluviatile CBS 122367]
MMTARSELVGINYEQLYFSGEDLSLEEAFRRSEEAAMARKFIREIFTNFSPSPIEGSITGVKAFVSMTARQLFHQFPEIPANLRHIELPHSGHLFEARQIIFSSRTPTNWFSRVCRCCVKAKEDRVASKLDPETELVVQLQRSDTKEAVHGWLLTLSSIPLDKCEEPWLVA